MRRLAALLTLALALACGCSSRQHLNPFDPANPETGGRPVGFVALAGEGSVILRWQPASSPRLIGYQAFRLAPGDSVFRAITTVMRPGVTAAIDTRLEDGVQLRYRLYFVFQTGLGASPAEDVATPGPLAAWVADPGSGTILRLSADGRRVAEVVDPAPLVSPFAIDVNPADGKVWSVGEGAGVLVYDPDLNSGNSIGQDLSSPLSVAVDRRDGSAWIGDDGSSAVYHLLATGAEADPPGLSGLQYPGGVAVDAADGSIWVTEHDGNRVRHYDAGGALISTATLSLPSRVAVDTLTHEAWVTSFSNGLVVRFSPDLVARDTVSISGPIGVAVDAVRGRVWVVDAQGDRVIALTRAGALAFQVTGLSEPREVALDEGSGEAWVTVTGAGTVARLSPTGARLAQAAGMRAPWGIALEDVRMRSFTTARRARP
ncbi:MAG TPA: hypothetical protein VMS88_05950 [Terriglobales bacterium]|nr:hypothetical protein [Terriglobales bacterium]